MQTQKTFEKVTQPVWRFDPAYTTVEFHVKKLFFFNVRGGFPDLEGSILLDETDITRSSVTATIKAASVDTRNSRRDGSLRSAGFLNVAVHPDIQFQSSQVKPGLDRDTLEVTGTLIIKGKSKEVKLDVSEVDRSRSPNGEEFLYYTATTTLDRFDFDVKAMPGLVGRLLKVTINVQASRRN